MRRVNKMTIFYYILTISALLLVIAIIIILKVAKFNKIEYYHAYVADECLENVTNSSLPGEVKIYASSKLNATYLKKYIVNKDGSDKILICNYTKPFRVIEYFVFVYNKNHKLKDVLQVKERETTTTSRVIGLPANAYDVNIVIKQVDGIALNSEIIKPMQNKKIVLNAFLISLAIFLSFFVLRQAILYIGFLAYSTYFLLESPLNIMTMAVILFLSLLNFVLIYVSLRRRNKKMRQGGILENEYF